mgnify:CR=1 FL=1
MIINFKQLPSNARLWVYQSDRPITAEESDKIQAQMHTFLTQWAAHGKDLNAGFEIKHQHFLLLALDEQQAAASGCSIDAFVNFITQMGLALNIDFFQRTNIAFWQDDHVELRSLQSIKKLVLTGELSSDVLFFDNSISTLGQLDSEWLMKPQDTWLKKYFPAAENV